MELKEHIFKKSFELFMRYGIKSVTMDDIARELGISKKTLYQYVDNKADLIHRIFEQHMTEEREIMIQIKQQSSNAINEILAISKYVVRLLKAISPTVIFDLQKYYRATWNKMDALHKQDIYKIIKENMEWGIRQGLYRSDLNTDMISKLYVGKSSLVVDEEIFPAREYNIGELFQQFINYHIQGIASDEGRKLLAKYVAIEQEQIK
jgi:AcrR family transcriptional regulator